MDNVIINMNNITFNDEYNKILLEKYEKYGARISKHLSKPENLYLVQYVKDVTPLLIDGIHTFATRLYWVFNKLTDFPKCKTCGKKLDKVNCSNIKTGYDRIYCSYKCLNTSADKKQKTKNTCILHYGVNNPFLSNTIKLKIKETNVQKYGKEFYTLTLQYNDKLKQTSLAKYGVDHPAKSIKVKNAIKASNLAKFGTENPFSSDVIKQKIQQTMVNRYGNNHPMHVKSILNKCSIHAFNNMIEQIKNNESEYIEILNAEPKNIIVKCKLCGNTFTIDEFEYNFYKDEKHIHARCLKCFPYVISSTPENDLYLYLKKTFSDIEILHNTRTVISPKELDIYIPSKLLAIEFDGLYWHSSAVLTEKFYGNIAQLKDYHICKTKLCEEKGILLVHIFENEWIYKQDIVKSRIVSMINSYIHTTIYARNCNIAVVAHNDACKFLNENHLLDAIRSKVNLGLYNNNQLISLMTFGKCRFDKKHEWEMLRFCNKLGYHIPGAAGKLLKYFEKNYSPKSLVTYADRRWSQGKLYKTLGFNCINISKPNYFYIKKGSLILESRIKFLKHKLKDILTLFDPQKTEIQNMLNNGYDVIYDCGNYVFEKLY